MALLGAGIVLAIGRRPSTSLAGRMSQAGKTPLEETTLSTATLPADATSGIEQTTMRRVIPFIFVCYVVAYLDRINIGFAALQVNRDLGLTSTIFGWGAGLFFLGYFVCELPSNLMLHRVGVRRWIAGGSALLVSVGNLGGFVGPFMIDFLKDTTQGFTIPLLAIAAILLIGAITMIILGDPGRSPATSRTA